MNTRDSTRLVIIVAILGGTVLGALVHQYAFAAAFATGTMLLAHIKGWIE